MHRQRTPTVKYIEDDLGISESRSDDLVKGLEGLHSAICKLDTPNLARMKTTTIEDLLVKYAELEGLRNPFEI